MGSEDGSQCWARAGIWVPVIGNRPGVRSRWFREGGAFVRIKGRMDGEDRETSTPGFHPSVCLPCFLSSVGSVGGNRYPPISKTPQKPPTQGFSSEFPPSFLSLFMLFFQHHTLSGCLRFFSCILLPPSFSLVFILLILPSWV